MTRWWPLIFLYWLTAGDSRTTDSRCEQMRIPWCIGAYDAVIFPNFLGHKTQEEAYYAMHKLWPLIQSRCSAEIGSYLCRLYAPQCPYLVRGRDAEYVSYYQPEQAKPPCEEACLRVKRDCQRVLSEHGMEWPPELDCQRLRREDCYRRPTVEVRPTEVPSRGRIDWKPVTLSTYGPTTAGRQPSVRPIETTTTRASAPSTTSERRQVIYQAHSATSTTSSAKSTAATMILAMTAAKTPRTEPSPSSESSAKSTPAAIAATKEAAAARLAFAAGEVTASPYVEVPRFGNGTTPGVGIGNGSETAVGAKRDFEGAVPNGSGVIETTENPYPPTSGSEVIAAIQEAEESNEEAAGSAELPNPLESLPKPLSNSRDSGEVSSDEIRFYPSYEPSAAICEPLTVPSCQNLGYGMTNIDEETQNLAAIQIFYFSPLVREVQCSDYLQPFLCAAYAPPCKGSENGGHVSPPCRSFCQSARDDCKELIEKLGFRWPEELECEKYPADSQKCVASLTVVEEEDEDESMMPPPPSRVRPPESLLNLPDASGEETLPALSGQHKGAAMDGEEDPVVPPLEAVIQSPDALSNAPDLPKAMETSAHEAPVGKQRTEAVDASHSPALVDASASLETRGLRCEPIVVEKCQNVLAYNSTRFPNMHGHSDQVTAGMALREYDPLIDVKCSSHMQLFLCAVLVPPCHPADDQNRLHRSIILPCRGLCEVVKKDCSPLLRAFGFGWPSMLNCSQFPTDEDSTVCIGGIGNTDQTDDRLTTASSDAPTTQSFDPDTKSRALDALRETAPLNPQCQNLNPSSTCRDLYEKTFYPNMLGHARQEEAELELRQFVPVIASNCSQHLKSFLCSIYAPTCTVLDYPVPPCRHLCSEARRGCEAVMNSFGFRWPSHFNCTQYPTWESGELCWNGAPEAAHAVTSTLMPAKVSSADTVLAGGAGATETIYGHMDSAVSIAQPEATSSGSTEAVYSHAASTLSTMQPEAKAEAESVAGATVRDSKNIDPENGTARNPIDWKRNLSAIPRADASLGAASAAAGKHQQTAPMSVAYVTVLLALAYSSAMKWT